MTRSLRTLVECPGLAQTHLQKQRRSGARSSWTACFPWCPGTPLFSAFFAWRRKRVCASATALPNFNPCVPVGAAFPRALQAAIHSARGVSFKETPLPHGGYATDTAETSQLQLYLWSGVEKMQRPGPEGPASSRFFRGLKPPAPSGICDLQLEYRQAAEKL